MSAPNPNWDRWILASISTHFKVAILDVFSLPMFVEGQHRETNKDQAWFEVRVDGPFQRQQQKDCWLLTVEVNCLISTSIDDFNFHDHRQNTGNVSSGFANCINVFRFGDSNPVPDDQTLLGVLKLRKGEEGRVITTHFGQLEPRVKMQQTTIEGHYEMQLSV